MSNLLTDRVLYVRPVVGSLIKVSYYNEDYTNMVTGYLQSITYSLDKGLGKVRYNHDMDRIFCEIVLVKVESCYHRAILLSVNASRTGFFVFLIDEAMAINTVLCDIRLINIPNIQEEGILHGVVALPEKWTIQNQLYVNCIVCKNFLKMSVTTPVTFPLVKVLVNNRIDLSVVLTSANIATAIEIGPQIRLMTESLSPIDMPNDFFAHYCNGGNKNRSEQFVIKQLEIGEAVDACVTYVSNGPLSFYVMMKSDHEIMYPSLRRKINNLITEPIPSPFKQQSCLAHDYNNILCRGIIVSVEKNEAHIHFVDFGYNHVVPFGKIYKIPREFTVPKAMAINVKLGTLNEQLVNEDVKNIFTKLFAENSRPVLLQVLPGEIKGRQSVEMFLEEDGILINIKQKFFRPVYDKVTLIRGKTYEVIVSHYNSLNAISVQLADCESFRKLEEITSKIKIYCENMDTDTSLKLEDLYTGMPVCAMNAFKEWRRAVILCEPKGTDEKISVCFVDYGNNESVCLERIKKIKPDLIKIPTLAVNCIMLEDLNDLDENNNTVLDAYSNLILGKKFSMRMLRFTSDGIPTVQLIDDSKTTIIDLLRQKLYVCINTKHFRSNDRLEDGLAGTENSSKNGSLDDVLDEFHRLILKPGCNTKFSVKVDVQKGTRIIVSDTKYCLNNNEIKEK